MTITAAHIFLDYVFPTIGSILGVGLCATPLIAMKVSPLPAVVPYLQTMAQTGPQSHSLLSFAQEAEKKGSLGNLNPLPTCVFMCNSVIWLAYGLALRNGFIFCGNVPAVPINIYLILHSYPLAPQSVRGRYGQPPPRSLAKRSLEASGMTDTASDGHCSPGVLDPSVDRR